MVKVKPLEWVRHIRDENEYLFTPNYSDFKIASDESAADNPTFIIFRYSINFTTQVYFNATTLKEAKAWVQEKWNEYVLSLIEIEEI